MQNNHKILIECLLCKHPFQFGPHRYEGRHIGSWEMSLCDICLSSNQDGIIADHHPQLVEHLQFHGKTFTLDEKGRIPSPSHSPV